MSFQSFRLRAPILQALKALRLSEPNPQQKLVMNAMKEAKDLLVVSPTKDRPELGPLILAVNDLIKEEVRSGTRIIALHPEEDKALKLAEWTTKLVNGTGLQVSTLTSEMAADEANRTVSKGSQILVTTPSLFRTLLGQSKIIFRDIRLLLVASASKVESMDDLSVISERCVGPEQRVFLTGKTPKEAVAALQEMMPEATRVGYTAAEEPEQVDRDAAQVGLSDVDEVKSTPSDMQAGLASSTEPPMSEQEVAEEAPLPIPTLDQFEKVHISDHTQIQALQNLILEHAGQRMVVFVIGPAESDALFKALRAKELNLVSVHGKLRRQTYEYRLSRFASGDVDIAVIGGGVKAQVVFENVDHLYFSYVPKSVQSLARALTYIRFRESSSVTILAEPSQRQALDQMEATMPTQARKRIMEGLSLNEFGRSSSRADQRVVAVEGGVQEKGDGDRGSTTGSTGAQQKNQTQGHTQAQTQSRTQGQTNGPSHPTSQSATKPDQRDRGRDERRQRGQGSPGGQRGQGGPGRAGGSGGQRGQGTQGASGTSSQRGTGKGGHTRDGNRRGQGGRGREDARQGGSPHQGRGGQKPGAAQPLKAPYGLPMPTYDRLEGGRAGKKKEQGLLGKIKRLFGG